MPVVRRQNRKSDPTPLKAPQADVLRHTRSVHANEIAEDYLEAIAGLLSEVGEARVTDLARQLGVSHVTVTRKISKLQQSGYVVSEPYRAIFLTEKGRAVAEKSKHRHQTVTRFLVVLGVSESIAARDAEGIEHHVSPETLAAMEGFIADRASD